MDFPTIQNFDIAKLKDLQGTIKADFPILQERKTPLLNINVNAEKNIDTKVGEALIWTFSNKEGNQEISIENNNFTIEFMKYVSFPEFFSKIKIFIEALFQIFPELISTRIGLRYINQIGLEEKNPLDWSDYISDDLIKVLNFFAGNILTRYISSIQIKNDTSEINFKFGIPNSLFPNPIIRKEFVLDFDCYTSESLERGEILKAIEDFHKRIKELFEKSIKEKLRQKMEA